MTNEERIEKASHSYSKRSDVINRDFVNAKQDFKNGAIWALNNPNWISVNDELKPKTWNAYLVRTYQRTRTCPNGNIRVAIYIDGEWRNDSVEYEEDFAKQITHWMELPSFNNKELE